MTQSDTPKPEPSPSPGGAGPEMEKIPNDPERDPRYPPATRRTTEVDRERDEGEPTDERSS